ncbi:hypothetical protein Peur_068881 [Populus x canadensis]
MKKRTYKTPHTYKCRVLNPPIHSTNQLATVQFSCIPGFVGNPYLGHCEEEKYFVWNGGLLLQEQLSSGEVHVGKMKLLTSKELDNATDHYNVNGLLGQGGWLMERSLQLKKSKILDEGNLRQFINEVVILSQINHRNLVKVLGCCLETEVPLLVYEFIPNGTLSQFLHFPNEELPLTWEMRLRIATEVAGALSYLHSSASIPIYHRDIKSTNTLQFTDKSDVYSFGVVLVELLTGQKAVSFSRSDDQARSLVAYFIQSMKHNHLFDILDPQVMMQGKKGHVLMVATLARSCLGLNGKERPTMKEDINISQEIEYDNGYEVMDVRWDLACTSTGFGFDNGVASSKETTLLLHTY